MIMLYCEYWKRNQYGVVGTAVCYRLNGRGIKSQWGPRISMLNRAAPKPTQPPVQWVASLLQGLKRLEHGTDHEPAASTGCNGSALYLHLPSMPAHRCHEMTFTITTTEDRMKHFKICPLWTYFLPLRYDGPRTVLIFCITMLGAVKLQTSHMKQ